MSGISIPDPRLIPVIGIDRHLPKVPMESMTPDALRQRFAVAPDWTPEILGELSFSDRSPVAASVLIGLVMREELTVLLTQRTDHLSSHSGQVAFPGGKMDPEDRDVAATALREAYEEVGLDPDSVDVLGVLPIYTTGSAFLVSPVVALLRPDMPLRANANEVASIFEVPLSFLMNPANHRRHAYERNGVQREWLSMPYVEGSQERFIWGATAGMLRNLYRFLVA
jgi:8-oxo-dGTP pyrophosphatase MutT (NUDIX family)